MAVTATMVLLVLAAVYEVKAELKVVDLTHPLNHKALRWPLYKKFELTVTFNGTLGDYGWVASNDISLAEHTGTHMDAPSHFSIRKGIWFTSDIPAHKLVRPLKLIDMVDQAAADKDYIVTPKDITDWEDKYGKIEEDSVVMVNFGWAKNYQNEELAFGSKNTSDPSTFHFPGIGKEAAELLLKRKIAGYGCDCPSVDAGNSKTLPVHNILLPENIYCLEHVGDMSPLPAGGKGVTLIVGAMSIERGTGGPIRLLATYDDATASGSTLKPTINISLVILICLYLMA